MKNIAIFASGGGSNFKAIHKNIELGNICAEIKLLVSNNSNSGAVEYAIENNIETFIINPGCNIVNKQNKQLFAVPEK